MKAALPGNRGPCVALCCCSFSRLAVQYTSVHTSPVGTHSLQKTVSTEDNTFFILLTLYIPPSPITLPPPSLTPQAGQNRTSGPVFQSRTSKLWAQTWNEVVSKQNQKLSSAFCVVAAFVWGVFQFLRKISCRA